MGLIADTDNLTAITCRPVPPIGWWGWFWSLIGWWGDTAPGHWAGYLTLGGEWRGWTLEYCQGGFEEDGSLGTNICSIITPGAGSVIITMMVTAGHSPSSSQWSTRAKSGFYDEALIKLQSNWDLLPEAICSESKLMWNTIWDQYCSPII